MDPAERIELGRTGCSISRFGLGTASLPFDGTAQDRRQATATIHRALELGINLIDTAALYVDGQGEAGVGEGIAGVPRKEFVLSTKAGYVMSSWPKRKAVGEEPDQDFSYAFIRGSVEASLDHLQVDRIDLLFLHDPPTEDLAIVREGAYEALVELRHRGRIGAIGAGMTCLKAACAMVKHLQLDVLMLACHYTLMMQHALEVLLPDCLSKSVPVLAAGPFSGGLLADPYAAAPDFNYRSATAPYIEKARRMDSIAAEFGTTLKSAALQFPLAHPAIVAILSGPASVAELEENLESLQHPVPPEFWAKLKLEGLIGPKTPTP